MTTERMIYIINNGLHIMYDGDMLCPDGMIFIDDSWEIRFRGRGWYAPIEKCHEIKSAWDEFPEIVNPEYDLPSLEIAMEDYKLICKWLEKYQSILEKTYIPDKESWELTQDEIKSLTTNTEKS